MAIRGQCSLDFLPFDLSELLRQISDGESSAAVDSGLIETKLETNGRLYLTQQVER